jgi:S1-C subfamily serine protease
VFVRAYELASAFTLPIVVSQRLRTGEVECGVGAGIVLNDEGWVATAAHMLEPLQRHAQGESEIANVSYWFGIDGWSVSQWQTLPVADLAVGRIDGFDAARVANYPVFKAADEMRPGASVCRLGFPFHGVKATFDDATGGFTLEPGTLPIPRFPNEGIVTRFIDAGTTEDGTHVQFVETSSPGLRGQSGGPIFDREGQVWAMQSRTTHLPLGFSPEVDVAGAKVTEHQFLNVGWGVHSQTLAAFARIHGAAVEVVARP